MIPTGRLIFWTAMIGVPFTLCAVTFPTTALLSTAVIGAFAFLVFIDAVSSRQRLRSIGIELPDVVRFQKDREGEIEILARDEAKRGLALRLGLAAPAELEHAGDFLDIQLPANVEVSRIRRNCTPHVRGRYLIEQCYLETPSRAGFWAIRRGLPVQSEIRVYPNLMEERKRVSALFLARGRSGIRIQRASGKGRDFEKLREYVPGDSYDEIHWRASAKRGHPVTKVFQVERTQEVYVILDASRLSGRTVPGEGNESASPTVLERFMTAALILGLAAEQQSDLFGLITFSDRIDRFVRARSGKVHYDACRDALYTLQPRLVTPNFEELTSFVRTRIRKRSLLVILTALDDPVLAESFTRSMDLICRQHLVFVNMVQPADARPLFDDQPVERIEDLYERLGGHLIWHDLRELEKVLQRRGVLFRQLKQEKLSNDLITEYLDVKSRQLL